jgi:hypothetical protein
MSCENTHDGRSLKTANGSAVPPRDPVLPPKALALPQGTRPLALPQPKRGWWLAHGQARGRTLAGQQSEDLKKMGAQKVGADFWMQKASGKRGRPDVVGYLSDRDGIIVENKTDRLDRLTEPELQARTEKYIEQVREYRESTDEKLNFDTTQSFLHFDERPTTPGYAEWVEDRCLDDGIMVVWNDE